MNWIQLTKKSNLLSDLFTNKIIPNDVLIINDYIINNNYIRINANISNSTLSSSSVYTFLYDYSSKTPYNIKKALIQNNYIEIIIDKSIVDVMQENQLNTVRLAILIKNNDNYVCCYFRNSYNKSESHNNSDSIIIAGLSILPTVNLYIYQTESGILSFSLKPTIFKNQLVTSTQCNIISNNLIIEVLFPYINGSIKCYILNENKMLAIESNTLEQRTTPTQVNYRLEIINFINYCLTKTKFYKTLSIVLEIMDVRFTLSIDQNTKNNLLENNIKITNPIFSEDTMACNSNKFEFTVIKTLLSIVTPVYNTKLWLSEMIESIMNQKLEIPYEFILVDDGSNDGSSELLDEISLISSNITVIHTSHSGVSRARNIGLKHSSGKYIIFPDSDDKLSKDYLKHMIQFFEDNDHISFVTTPMIFFDASQGEHWSNYKFNKVESIIDLNRNPNNVTYSVCCTLFKNEVIKSNNIYFDENVINGEDWLFICDYYSKFSKPSIGLLPNIKYLYRRRSSGTKSAVISSKFTEFNYIPHIENVFKKVIKENLNHKSLPKFIQYMVMGQLQWKYIENDCGRVGKIVIGERKYNIFKNELNSLLKYIDDDVILNQPKLYSEHKYYLLSKKYNTHAEIILKNDDAYYYFGRTAISTTIANSYIYFDYIIIENNYLILEGYSIDLNPEVKLCIKCNNKSFNFRNIENRDSNKYTLDDICLYAKTFRIKYKLDNSIPEHLFTFYGVIHNIEILKSNYKFSKRIPLSLYYKNSFYINENFVIQKHGSSISIKSILSNGNFLYPYEKNFHDEILCCATKSSQEAKINRILKIRTIALSLLSQKLNQKIYLIADRTDLAGDNGEALFDYINSIRDANVTAYFVLDKASIDYKRIKNNVVVLNSDFHLILALISDYIITSSCDEAIHNPFLYDSTALDILKDLLSKPKHIFLQHGVTKDDISSWINRYSKNLSGIICASKNEVKSFLKYNYFYDEESIWLTGFPRFDLLYNNDKRYITIMPTWRKSLTTGAQNRLASDFQDSEYFKRYNSIINNTTLISSLLQHNYILCFMPHPNIRRDGIEKFQHNPNVIFFDFNKSYKSVFAESSLLITDYSSTAFDFALLKKPIIYYQFDKDQFFNAHSYKIGYFDYKKDGFGEIVENEDDLVKTIIKYVKNNCTMDKKFSIRVDNFFEYNDKNNCMRVFNKINAI